MVGRTNDGGIIMDTGKLKHEWIASSQRLVNAVKEKQSAIEKEQEGQNRKWLVKKLFADYDLLIEFYDNTEKVLEESFRESHKMGGFANAQLAVSSHFEAKCAALLELIMREGGEELTKKALDIYVNPAERLWESISTD